MSKSLKIEKSNIIKSTGISLYEGKYVLDNKTNCSAELIKDLTGASEVVITGYNIMARFGSEIFIIAIEIRYDNNDAKIFQKLAEIPVKINCCTGIDKYRTVLHCNTDAAIFNFDIYKKTGYYGTEIGKNDKYIITIFEVYTESESESTESGSSSDDSDEYCLIVYDKCYDVIGIRLLKLNCDNISDLSVYFIKNIIVLKDRKNSFTITAEDNDNECPVCFESSDVFCVPCGHSLCHKCYFKLVNKSCPECRQTIISYITARYNDNKEITKYIYKEDRKAKKAKSKKSKKQPKPDPSPEYTIKKK